MKEIIEIDSYLMYHHFLGIDSKIASPIKIC